VPGASPGNSKGRAKRATEPEHPDTARVWPQARRRSAEATVRESDKCMRRPGSSATAVAGRRSRSSAIATIGRRLCRNCPKTHRPAAGQTLKDKGLSQLACRLRLAWENFHATPPTHLSRADTLPFALDYEPDARLAGNDYTPPANPCTQCELREDTLPKGRCGPGDACLFVYSGRQIDRFLARNPEWAEFCLDDPFWERRAIAVRYAPQEAAMRLERDEDEVVRRAVAVRAEGPVLERMARDPDREVRITVATRMPPAGLARMLRDPDYGVRIHVARRLPHGQLPQMVDDPDPAVRKEIARRLPAFALSKLAADPEPEVRALAASRMLPADAAQLLADPEWLVRAAAVQQAPLEALSTVLDDPEPDVRLLAAERLAAGPT